MGKNIKNIVEILLKLNIPNFCNLSEFINVKLASIWCIIGHILPQKKNRNLLLND